MPPGPLAYLRMRALGETRAFGPIALERIVRAVGQRRDVFAVLETDTALKETKRLRGLVNAERAAAGCASPPGRATPRRPRPVDRAMRDRGLVPLSALTDVLVIEAGWARQAEEPFDAPVAAPVNEPCPDAFHVA